MWTDLPIERAFINPSTIGDGQHLWVFTTGPADLSRRGWSDAEIAEFVVRELGRVRPSTIGRVEPVGVRAWTRDPTTLGTYAARAPGQIKRFGQLFSEPAGRLIFAGEHTAEQNLGIEGAMESGEHAARVAVAQI
jgi:monoamine oxidase